VIGKEYSRNREKRNTYKFSVGKPEEKRAPGRLKCR
jgi:hypothetical protein